MKKNSKIFQFFVEKSTIQNLLKRFTLHIVWYDEYSTR